MSSDSPPVNSDDFYFENGMMVMTENFHLKRGYCCESGCRHCPYGFQGADQKKVNMANSDEGSLAHQELSDCYKSKE